MKTITETDLKKMVDSLNEYRKLIEATQPAQPAGAWDKFKTWATTPVIGGSDPKAATKWVQQQVGATPDGKWGAKSDAALSKWATTPIGGSTQAAKPAAPAQGAKPAAPAQPAAQQGSAAGFKSPAEVQELQNMLNSMGYNIKVDGIWGPKTQAAYQQAYSQMYGQQPGQTDPNEPVPQNYQQGQAQKKDLSKDAAAAVGIQNPYAKPEPQAPAQPQQPAAQEPAAQQGSVFGADGKITGMPAQQQPAKKVVDFTENSELDRIIQLSKKR